jgi:hypothetical protein
MGLLTFARHMGGIQVATASTPTIVKGHCPQCGANRNAEVLHEHTAGWSDEEAGIFGQDTSQMLKCCGCDTVYFEVRSIDSEDYDQNGPKERVTYYPAPSKRNEPSWMWEMLMEDDKLHSLLKETYAALNNDARVLAAVGLRTIFDRASEKFGVDPDKSFKAKLDELVTLGKIGQTERDSLDVLTDAGGAAAHRGWKPSVGQLGTLMNIGEAFLYRTIILDAEAQRLKKSIFHDAHHNSFPAPTYRNKGRSSIYRASRSRHIRAYSRKAKASRSGNRKGAGSSRDSVVGPIGLFVPHLSASALFRLCYAISVRHLLGYCPPESRRHLVVLVGQRATVPRAFQSAQPVQNQD